MAKPNYAFAKRQRDLAKKQKKEEKKLRKAGPATEGGGDNPAEQGEQAAQDSPDRVAGQDPGQGVEQAADQGRNQESSPDAGQTDAGQSAAQNAGLNIRRGVAQP